MLACSPQYRVTDWFDGRYEAAAKGIEWLYCISADSICENCIYWLVYDSKDYDAVHAMHLRVLTGEANYHEITLPHAGHATVFYLYELGLLQQTMLSIFNGKPVSTRALLRDKRRSRQYLTTLSDRLAARRPALAARIKSLKESPHVPPLPLRWAIDAKFPLLSAIAAGIEMQRLRHKKFDEKFYRHLHWDVAISGEDPLMHYIRGAAL